MLLIVAADRHRYNEQYNASAAQEFIQSNPRKGKSSCFQRSGFAALILGSAMDSENSGHTNESGVFVRQSPELDRKPQ
jgi:hypothetical protein